MILIVTVTHIMAFEESPQNHLRQMCIMMWLRVRPAMAMEPPSLPTYRSISLGFIQIFGSLFLAWEIVRTFQETFARACGGIAKMSFE
jgi:hypothetical protein